MGGTQTDGSAAGGHEVSNANCGVEGNTRQLRLIVQPTLQKENKLGFKANTTRSGAFTFKGKSDRKTAVLIRKTLHARAGCP